MITKKAIERIIKDCQDGIDYKATGDYAGSHENGYKKATLEGKKMRLETELEFWEGK